MRPERFTEQAQEALAASQQLVTQYHHSQWDVEHVLLALLQQEKGLVGEILQELGVDLGAVRGEVMAVLEKVPSVTYETGQIYATPRINSLVTGADAEANRLKDEFIIKRGCILLCKSCGVGTGLPMPGRRANIAAWISTVVT
jgi:ATP-dependent Clp protease ATP-binding subunit ClpC